MNVLAINSSIRKSDPSNTQKMLTPLLQGMREAGANVEVVYLRGKNIQYCLNCYSCMTKTPGRCMIQDDMTREIFPKWLEADICVYAGPVIHHTINAPMKTFIERTYPVHDGVFFEEDGVFAQKIRSKHPAVVFLAVGGSVRESHLDCCKQYVRHLFAPEHYQLLADIYRISIPMLVMPQFSTLFESVVDATIQAGRELVQNRAVSPETLARIQEPLPMEPETLFDVITATFQTMEQAGVNQSEFAENQMMPRPSSVAQYMSMLKFAFNPANAGADQVVIQFDFNGQADASCHLRIRNSGLETELGPADSPDMTIQAPFELWMDILTGKADGAESLINGKYTVAGNTDLLMEMGRWFSA